MGEVGHEAEVLASGEELVDGGELTGDAEGASHGVGRRGDVVTGDAGPAAVGADEGGQDADDGRLAGAVGAEKGVDGARRDGQVDAPEDLVVVVLLDQAGGLDRCGFTHDDSVEG